MERKIVPFTRRSADVSDPAFERALFLAEAEHRELCAVVPVAEPAEPKFMY